MGLQQRERTWIVNAMAQLPETHTTFAVGYSSCCLP